jgi:hypothetical protein
MIGAIRTIICCYVFFFVMLVLAACDIGGQQQNQPDRRLKLFHVISARIIMLDNQAEVDGTVQNTGTDPFPFDVTILATFYDSSGKVIGQAQGVAEDVRPRMTQAFVLMGQVDSAAYSRMDLAPVSLVERRQEKNLPTPTPVVP